MSSRERNRFCSAAVAVAVALLGGATRANAAPGDTTTDDGTFTVDTTPDGAAHTRDTRNLRAGVQSREQESDYDANVDDRPMSAKMPTVGPTIATFDITDWFMRGRGHDPYASAKLAALDASRDARAAQGERYRATQLAHASTLMQANLDHLWATERDAAARRRAVFEMWDECAETGTAPVIAAGTAARERLESFVRQTLPAGTPGAFTPAELAALNAHRLSRVAFAPY